MAALVCAGCTSIPYVNGATTGLGSDNAAIMVNYGGIYGPVKILRCNPKPGQSVVFGSDGNFTVTWTGNTNGNLPAVKQP